MKKLINSFEKIQFSKILFVFSLVAIAMGYGFLAYPLKWFPYQIIQNAVFFMDEKTNPPNYYYETNYTSNIPIYNKDAAYKSLSLVTSIAENDQLSAKIINMEGRVIHEWNIDWFKLWPDVKHIPEDDPFLPKEDPGTNVNGAVLLDDGDLIFNFSNLGMIRLDLCGNVVWRLPYRTHHSIYLDENNNLWAPGMVWQEKELPDFPNLQPPFYEMTLLKVSLDGEILSEISVLDILKKNDLLGLLYLSDIENKYADITTDPLHLNEVETFPSFLDEGVFQHGDIMISLRNRNTILVFREEDLRVSQVITGGFVRQHDPDFIDGDTISVFDNNSIAPEQYNPQSNIRVMNVANGTNLIYYTGGPNNPFFSSVIGRHQWLPNGDLLITESVKGKAFEVNRQGDIVWKYVNLVADGYAGLITEVSRLPVSFTEETLNNLSYQCETRYSD
ncbi:arylsulfotransferase family protein [bacterium]|nr:arylsulfotransferase family protein [bacterium]